MADLQTIDQLEGALSPHHTQQIRAAVIAKGGSLDDYQAVLTVEAIGSPANFSVQVERDPNTGTLYLETNGGQTHSIPFHQLAHFCQAASLSEVGIYTGDTAQQIWAVAAQYAE